MKLKKFSMILLIVVFSILLTGITFAQNGNFSIDKSYSWLVGQQDTTGCFPKGTCSVDKTSLAVLALSKGGYATNAEDGAVWLLDQQDTTGCFPKGTCNVKTTALATLALKKSNKDVTKSIEWLITSEQAAATDAGNWWLQVIADSGTCTLSYEGLTTAQTITITDGKFVDCGNNYWFNLKDCVTGTPLKTKPSQKFSIDCGSAGNPKISLIYNSGNKYYLLKENSGSIEINVDNGCWGSTKTTACSYEPTWYASYALKEAGEDISSMIWLRDHYQTNDILYNIFMSLFTDRTLYLEALKALQQQSGSFNNNIQQTSLVILALSKSSSLSGYNDINTKSIDWIKTKQDEDGSWNKDVLDTAYVLYGLQITPTGEAICGDGYCDIDESEISCPKDCKSIRSVVDIEICDDSIDNDEDGDVDCDDIDCYYDYACGKGSGFIEEPPEVETDCSDELDNDDDGLIDCADPDCSEDSTCKKSSLLLWVAIIIVIILLVLGGYFAQKKGMLKPVTNKIGGLFKKKPKKPSTPTAKKSLSIPRLQQVPRTRAQSPKTNKKEDELSKSIREARKLMGIK